MNLMLSLKKSFHKYSKTSFLPFLLPIESGELTQDQIRKFYKDFVCVDPSELDRVTDAGYNQLTAVSFARNWKMWWYCCCKGLQSKM